jgi:glycosyltransferase involved in cell wall biosynthesis
MPAKVAIVTRTKDRPLLLKRAIDSVAKQTFQDWTQVIVNDGGDAAKVDALVDALPAALKARLSVLHHPDSLGMQAASNAGIESSESDFICIHDDDDQWDPAFLEKTVGFLETEGAKSPYQGVVAGTEEVIETIGSKNRIKEISRKPHIPLEEISLFRMGYENPFPPIAFCFRRSAWKAIGGFDPRWDVVGDMDFNLRFLLRYEIGVIPEVLAYYHIRESASKESFANSIAEKKSLHKRLFNEFKNTHLRNADSPQTASLALGLNVANYLVEAQWILHDVFHRTRQNHDAVEVLGKAIALEGYEDRFTTLREALAILVDHARDTGLRDEVKGTHVDLARIGEDLGKGLERIGGGLHEDLERIGGGLHEDLERIGGGLHEDLERIGGGLHEDLMEASKARQSMGARFEELIRSTGLPVEGDEFETVRQALHILIDHARDPSVRDYLKTLQGDLQEAARVRHETAARLEELIRSVGIESGEGAAPVQQKLTWLVDFIKDPTRNGEAFRDKVFELLENLERRLAEVEQRTLEVRIGRLRIATIKPSKKQETGAIGDAGDSR